MSTEFITTNSTTAVNITQNNSFLYLAEGVLLGSSLGPAVSILASTARLIISGEVVTPSAFAIQSGSFQVQTGGGHSVEVTQTGFVSGINLDGGASLVRNSGEIRSTQSSALLLEDGSASVFNTGLIVSTSPAIVLTGATSSNTLEFNVIENTGTIVSTNIAIRSLSLLGIDTIVNHGLILGNIDLFEGSDRVDNTGGEIRGRIDLGEGADTMTGGDLLERVTGGTGNDSIDLGGGNDVFRAVSVLLQADGDDEVDGGTGIDTYDGQALIAAVDINLSAGWASGINIGFDLLSSIENALGGIDDDRLTGNKLANLLSGGSGIDTLSGLGGNDRLKGDGGNDVLIGGTGRDVMTGGQGQDRFDFDLTSHSAASETARDVITDFTSGEDKIDLLTIDANKGQSGNNVFQFIDTNAFSKSAGQLRYEVGAAGQSIIVEADTDGDGIADLQIVLRGATAITVNDFIL